MQHNFCLCFKIETKCGKIILLSDLSSGVRHEGNYYTPYSGLEFDKAILDESGINIAILNGYFEDKGIAPELSLLDAKISIFIYQNGNMKLWMKYSCSEVVEDGMKFTLTLTSLAVNYDKQIVEYYGKSCRAKFGDKRCGVDLLNFPGEICDKSFTMCANKYNNVINFRGEPMIPSTN